MFYFKSGNAPIKSACRYYFSLLYRENAIGTKE